MFPSWENPLVIAMTAARLAGDFSPAMLANQLKLRGKPPYRSRVSLRDLSCRRTVLTTAATMRKRLKYRAGRLNVDMAMMAPITPNAIGTVRWTTRSWRLSADHPTTRAIRHPNIHGGWVVSPVFLAALMTVDSQHRAKGF